MADTGPPLNQQLANVWRRLGLLWYTHVTASELGNVVSQHLHGYDRDYALETVHAVGHLHEAGGLTLSLHVVLLADQYGLALHTQQAPDDHPMPG